MEARTGTPRRLIQVSTSGHSLTAFATPTFHPHTSLHLSPCFLLSSPTKLSSFLSSSPTRFSVFSRSTHVSPSSHHLYHIRPTSMSINDPQSTEEPASSSSPAPQKEMSPARRAAEKLALEAERAKLAAEKAQIEADKRRIELEKIKMLSKEQARSKPKISANPYEREQNDDIADSGATQAGKDAFIDNKSDKDRDTVTMPRSLLSDKDQPRSKSSDSTNNSTTNNSSVRPVRDNIDTLFNNLADPQKEPEKFSDTQFRILRDQVFISASDATLSSDDQQTVVSEEIKKKYFSVMKVERTSLSDRVSVTLRLKDTSDPEQVLQVLYDRIKTHGLDQKVRLFLFPDIEEANQNGAGLGEMFSALNSAISSSPSKKSQPVVTVIALPFDIRPKPKNTISLIVALASMAFVAFTCFSFGLGSFGATPGFISELESVTQDEQILSIVSNTIPISGGLFATLWAHEIAHWIAAKFHNVKLSIPYFFPSLQLGSYGSITPFSSYPKNRSQFFDIAAAGPLVGVTVSLACLIIGLGLSGVPTSPMYPQVPIEAFQSSLLTGVLMKALIPADLLKNGLLSIHPLAWIGKTGLLINALNLLPVGRLDGGRIVQSLFGRKNARLIGGIALILQGLGGIYSEGSILLFWSITTVFLQRELDIPCENEITEPDNARSALGLALLVVMILTLIPYPGSFTN